MSASMRYLPLDANDRKSMLARVGVADIDDLFADIPERAPSKPYVDQST